MITDTMAEAIALSSPSGRMSKRARKAADARLHDALFGPDGLQPGPLPVRTADDLRQRAADLRALAARGMRPRVHLREADRLERAASAMVRP